MLLTIPPHRTATHATSSAPPLPVFEPAAPDELDPITGLRNNIGLLRYHDRLIHTGFATASIGAFRVDSYDIVRRRHGDTIGNMLLAFVSTILLKELGTDDCLAHSGEGEFILMLANQNADGLHSMLARFSLALFCHPFPLPAGGSERVRISSRDSAPAAGAAA